MTDSVISHTLIFSQSFSHAEQRLLTSESILFLETLVARFAPQCEVLLSARQQRYDQAIA